MEKEPWGNIVKEQLLERIDFLSDHWVNGDDKRPFSFGGWREEVAEELVTLVRTQREQARQEGVEAAIELIPDIWEVSEVEAWNGEAYLKLLKQKIRSKLLK